jgi:hypothetical protein
MSSFPRCKSNCNRVWGAGRRTASPARSFPNTAAADIAPVMGNTERGSVFSPCPLRPLPAPLVSVFCPDMPPASPQNKPVLLPKSSTIHPANYGAPAVARRPWSSALGGLTHDRPRL